MKIAPRRVPVAARGPIGAEIQAFRQEAATQVAFRIVDMSYACAGNVSVAG